MTEQHADLYRLVKWQPKPMLERDLPPGVEYQFEKHGQAYTALSRNLFLISRYADGEPCRILADGERNSARPVTILDWPVWTTPRPDSTPTWADIIDGAPAESVAWFEDRDGTPHLCKIPASPRPTPPHNRFVGWLVPA